MELIKNLLNKLPYVRGLYAQTKSYNDNCKFPPGHFYSPIVNFDEVLAQKDRIYKNVNTDGIPGIDLRREEQISLAKELSTYYDEMPFGEKPKEGLRYYLDNIMYTYTDGIVLYSMIRHLKPKRIIEVGSGFSSALMMDTNDLFFNGQIELTFVEPYPQERLHKLLSSTDKQKVAIHEDFVQNIDLAVFKKLQKGDILFIDSSHVSKTGSDLNYLIFEVLPILNDGVFIHFHDITYPFEYHLDWVQYNWNENFLLRAFLMYNSRFQIRLFSGYLQKLHLDATFKNMPLAYTKHGANIWLEKVS